jgi:hypothetical protein
VPFPFVTSLPKLAVYDPGLHTSIVVSGTNTAIWNGAGWVDDGASTPGLVSPALAEVNGLGPVLVGSPLVGPNTDVHVFLKEAGKWADQGSGPIPRSEHALGFDPIAGTLIVFGGSTIAVGEQRSLELDDTWAWDPATRQWAELAPIANPPPRSGQFLAWDRARAHLVLLGGASTGGLEPWEWDRDQVSWRPILATGTAPLAGLASSAVPAPDGDGIALLGGLSRNGSTVTSVFRMRWSGTGPLEACGGAFDLDHDGLAGCADPDCTVACQLAATTCGDATCNVAETCVTCPQDCGTCRERCGDFVCSAGETETECPGDCQQP